MNARAAADDKLDANEFFQDLTPDPEFAKWQREQTACLSEKALIGALLQEHDRVFPIVQGAGITAASFTDAVCSAAWRAMEKLRAERKVVDLVAVPETMGGDAGENLAALGGMVQACPTTAHAAHYAQQVREAERRRALLLAAKDAQERLQKGGAVEVVAAQLKEAGEAAEGEKTVLLPATDAAAYIETEPPPHDPIIENIFDMGDKAELIGGSKQKKSLTTIEISLHVATGRDWLGLKIPKRRRVLYVNLELRDGWIWRRIRRACRAHGIGADELRGWLTVINARSRGEIIRHHLVELAAREDAELVVVDPRYKLQLPGESENAGEGIGEILNLFDRVAEDGRALLVVHHDPKGDGGDKAIADRGGGSGWAGRDVDARLCLTPQKQEPDGASVVSIMARNYPPTPDFCIRWGDHRFELAPELMPAPFTSWDRRRMLVGSGGAASKDAEDYNAVALDAAAKPQSRNEILCRLQKAGASRDLARACLDALVADGKIAHTPRTGKKGGAVRYGTPYAIESFMNPPLIGAKSK